MAYPELCGRLKDDQQYVTAKGHSVHRVCPFMDERGILRVNGRLPASLYPVEVRQPVILPSSDRIVKLKLIEEQLSVIERSHIVVWITSARWRW